MTDQDLQYQEQAMAAFAARDLWWEARTASAAYKPSWFQQFLIMLVLFFVNLKAIITGKKRMGLTARMFGTGASAYCVDLNKYRPNINVELLIDQGVRVFMLRVGGPRAWVYPTEFIMDQTFVPYYERIRAYAKLKNIKVVIIGYGVHDAWSNEAGNYNGLDPQVKWLKEATRNHLCDCYCWDDEVATIWKNGQETTITGVNLVKSISRCMEQTLTEMEYWGPGKPKIPLHYSANWFMAKYAKDLYTNWLDNAAVDPQNRRFLTWRAWYPIAFNQLFGVITELFDKLPTPTGIQENNYLRMGSGPAADFWQCTDRANGPWGADVNNDGKPEGCDASISYGLSATFADFCRNANIPLTDTPPVDPPPGDNGDYATVAQLNEVKATVATLVTAVNGINAATKLS